MGHVRSGHALIPRKARAIAALAAVVSCAALAWGPLDAASAAGSPSSPFCKQATSLRKLAQSAHTSGKGADLDKFKSLAKGFGQIAKLTSDQGVASAAQSMGAFFGAVGDAGSAAKAKALLADAKKIADYNKAASVYGTYFTATCGPPPTTR
jgi:hypothetical protein